MEGVYGGWEYGSETAERLLTGVRGRGDSVVTGKVVGGGLVVL